MRILFSIILNASILFAIVYFLQANPDKDISDWVILWCGKCSILSQDAIITYIIWWVILWLINISIKPALKILTLPLFFIYPIVNTAINTFLLWILNYIMSTVLIIPGIWYKIDWLINFVIAVAIFTFLNMLYSLLFNKK